jgi:hypothetical protein
MGSVHGPGMYGMGALQSSSGHMGSTCMMGGSEVESAGTSGHAACGPAVTMLDAAGRLAQSSGQRDGKRSSVLNQPRIICV